ncbi:MAG: oligosaccharide flippase family protein [Calditrichota bacterium]
MNLAAHWGRFSWVAASRVMPLIYGAVFVLVVIPALPVEEHGKFAIVFSLFSATALLNKYLVLHPMIRYASLPGQFAVSARAGFQLSLLFYIAAGFIIWVTAPITAAMWRISAVDVRLAVPLLAAIFFREYGFCIQQTLFRASRLFALEAVYFLGAATGFVYLLATHRLVNAEAALEVILYSAVSSSLLAVILGGRLSAAVQEGTGRDTRPPGWFKLASLDQTVVILKYGLSTLVIGLTGSIIYGTDILLIAGFYTPTEVALYNGGKQVYRMVTALTQAVALLAMPYAARLESQGKGEELRGLFEKTQAYTFLLLAALTAGVWLTADSLYGLFLGEKYAGSAPILRIMMLGAPFEGLYTVGGNILYGLGAAAPVAVISLISMGVWLGTSVVGVYTMGVLGGALGLSAAMIYAGGATFRIGARRFNSSVGATFHRLVINLKTLLY